MKAAITIICVILLVAALGSSALAGKVTNTPPKPANTPPAPTNTTPPPTSTGNNTNNGNGNSQAGGLPALADRVQKLEGQVVLLISQVGSLKNVVSALQGAVGALQNAVSALQNAVSDLQATVGNLKAGVMKLLGQNNWAVVDSSGNVVRHSGVADVTAVKLGTGTYEVTFAKDVKECAYVATIGDVGKAVPIPGFITVSGDVDGDSPNDVQVQTFDKTGTAADSPFHLYVSCP